MRQLNSDYAVKFGYINFRLQINNVDGTVVWWNRKFQWRKHYYTVINRRRTTNVNLSSEILEIKKDSIIL